MSGRITGVPTQRTWIQAFLLLAVAGGGARAQQVRLRVTGDTIDTPVSNALVISLTDRAVWRTDDDGILTVRPLHPGPNVFTIRRLGLAPVTITLDVPEHGTRAVHVIMNPAPQVLDPVNVNAQTVAPKLSAFDENKLHNVGGHFITWADIEQRHALRTTDLFRNVLGFQVNVSPTGQESVTSTRGISADFGLCSPYIGLDGMVFQGGLGLNDIAPSEIYGIEAYSGVSTIPAQYMGAAGQSPCGLIMIWTQSGAQLSAKRGP